METSQEIYDQAVAFLSETEGVSVAIENTNKIDTAVYKSEAKNSLTVTLSHMPRWDIVAIEIDGADCSRWHTGEEENLDFHLELAKSSLLGDIGYNRSPILRRNEICFKVGDVWGCTLAGSRNRTYSYVSTRKKIKHIL